MSGRDLIGPPPPPESWRLPLAIAGAATFALGVVVLLSPWLVTR